MIRLSATLLTAAALLAACGASETAGSAATRAATAGPAEPLQITVSIVPQKYFVERIGGEHVSVNVLVAPGASPATYEPKPAQLTALSQADAYVSIGVPFENAWMDRIASANPEMLMVDTTRGIERRPMGAERREPEGRATGSEAASPDPHIWLSPRLVKVQAQTICAALVELDPAHRETYKANLDGFLADIDVLIADINDTLAGLDQRRFIVFHPAWGYFADEFDLEMIPIEVGGQEPSAAELADLITRAQDEGIKVIFAQPEFSTTAAEAIAGEIGGEVLLISPLAPDWLSNLRQVATTFANALGR